MNNIENDEKSSNYEDKRTIKRKIGDIGELVACRFLMKQNYKIVGRNYLKKYGEIDIIAYKSDIFHFIEVKTVTRDLGKVIHETVDVYRPEDNIHPWKLKRLGRVIQAYLMEKKIFDADWKFDVITVHIDRNGQKAAINMLENIVL